MKTITCISFAATAILLASAGARADSATAGDSVAVRYDDLNLNRAADSPLLYSRLARAAQDVCKALDVSSEPIHRELKAAHESCMQHAIAAAVGRIDQAEFTAYAQTRLALLPAQYALLTKK